MIGAEEYDEEIGARVQERARAARVRAFLVFRLGDRVWTTEERARELAVLDAAVLRRDPAYRRWFEPEPEPEPVLDEGPGPVEEEGPGEEAEPARPACANEQCDQPLPLAGHPATRYCSRRCGKQVANRRFNERRRALAR